VVPFRDVHGKRVMRTFVHQQKGSIRITDLTDERVERLQTLTGKKLPLDPNPLKIERNHSTIWKNLTVDTVSSAVWAAFVGIVI
jgi:hypothetical protein